MLVFISISCSKERQTLLNTTWEVESIKVHTDSILIYSSDRSGGWKNTPIILSFPKQSKYYFHLEANFVEGKFFITGNKINFKDEKSTLVCCDSPFALSCIYLLEHIVNHYSISDTKLVLMGNKGEKITFIQSVIEKSFTEVESKKGGK